MLQTKLCLHFFPQLNTIKLPCLHKMDGFNFVIGPIFKFYVYLILQWGKIFLFNVQIKLQMDFGIY